MHQALKSPVSDSEEAISYTRWMGRALELAAEAAQRGEVPVGAILLFQGKPISEGYNLVEMTTDASAHAEMIALRSASLKLGRWRLSECTLVVTLEPCIMCAAAIRLARIPRVVFGAPDERFGGFGTVIDLAKNSSLGPLPTVVPGVLAGESALLLRSFFRQRRQHNVDS